MGLFKLFSGSGDPPNIGSRGGVASPNIRYTPTTKTSPNPNKYRFAIRSIVFGERYDLVQVHYPDCTTFNGIKVLVVKKDSITSKTKEIDPHFFENGNIVARFAPTEEGIKLATEMI